MSRLVNKKAVRSWLSKALDTGEPGDGAFLAGWAKVVPEWACLLHSAGAWAYMSYEQVRVVAADETLQRALLATSRLVDSDDVLYEVLTNGLGEPAVDSGLWAKRHALRVDRNRRRRNVDKA